MNKIDILKKKVEYATKDELLFLLLNDTDMKFKNVISYWKENNVEGTKLAGKLMDNLLYLKNTINTNVGNEKTREALDNIKKLYEFIIQEITMSSFHKDYNRAGKAYKVFCNIKSMFDTDKENASK